MLACESVSEVAAFVHLWHGRAREDFLAAHAAPFLLGEPAAAAEAVGRFDTLGVGGPAPRPVETGERPTDRSNRPGHGQVPDRLVPVAKRPGGAFSHMISVGRAPNNDVVLPFGSVSKLHAIFTPPGKPGDTWALADAGSTNGTFVDRRALPTHERRPVRDNARLLFGDVAFLFILPATLHDILGELARRYARFAP